MQNPHELNQVVKYIHIFRICRTI